jgi:eukaryotic-like serine/threonine-protein kinase
MSLTDKLIRPDTDTHRWPVFLPDGDHFLMFGGNFGPIKDHPTNGIILSSLSKVEEKHLVSTNSSAGYSDGRVYYVDPDGSLMAAKLDVSAGKLDGAPQLIAGQVAESPSTFYGVFAVSLNSTVVYSTNSTPSQSQFTWIDESGKELGRIGSPGVLANPSISPDGKRVAFDSEDFKANNVDVWISSLERGASSRFTFEPTEEVTPAWSRDGSTIAYRNILPLAVHLKKANGLEPDRALPQRPAETDDLIPNSWAPGDREVLCTYQHVKGHYELVLVPVDGSKIHALLNGSGNETNGQFSPDGKWVAYASDETGKPEIYATTYPGAAGKWQMSHGGGAEPRWRGDGKAIFYIAPGQMLTEAEVSTGDSFSAGIPRPLFQIHTRAPISSTDLFNYDVAPDGKRFLVNQYIKPDQPPPLRIVLDAGASR